MIASCILLVHCSYNYRSAARIAAPLVGAQRLLGQVRRIRGHGQDTERVGVAKTTLPALDCDDRRARLDDVEQERVPETETDTVVDLRGNTVSVPPMPHTVQE